MRGVVELAPEPHGAPPEPGYRLEVRDCFYCWRDLHVYVPAGPTELVITGVLCPHCHKWEAETLIPLISKPVLVRACKRTWLGWQGRRAVRRMSIIRAYARIVVSWPYWALYRVVHRVAANAHSPAKGDE